MNSQENLKRSLGVNFTSGGQADILVWAPTANQVPAVSLTAPANGATFTAPATMTVSASATEGDGASMGNSRKFAGLAKVRRP